MKHYQIRILKKMGKRPSKKVLDKLTPEELYTYNTYRQKIKGDKKYHYFEITEFRSDNKIFEKTILEFDKEDFEFQERMRKEGIDDQRKWQKKRGEKPTKKYKIKKYSELYLSGHWFRAIIPEEWNQKTEYLVYGQLESARSYIFMEVLEKLEKEIEKKYPFIYARPFKSPIFEKTDKKGYSVMTDSEKRAAGKEKDLETLTLKLRELHEEIENFILKEIKPFKNYTFRKYCDKPRYDSLDLFIIGGKKAAKEINFSTFFYDFYDRIQPVEVLDIIIKNTVKIYRKKLIKG